MRSSIARRPLLLLLGAFAAGCALHIDRVPAWCTAFAAASLVWRWLHFRGHVALPNQLVRVIITAVLLGAILLSYRTVSGLAAGSALLVVMGSAKLLETRAPRDAVVVATTALVLVLAAALDRQGLLRLPLYFGTGWLALASMTALGSIAAAQSARRAFLASGRAALYAMPLAALCFVLVPRLPGALWAVPGGSAARTGLSDEMSPGGISDLAISEDIAFRVRFHGPPPPPDQRYWRGPVLHDFDGYTWRRRRGQYALPQREQMLSPPLSYHVMLEPQGHNYLFGLDTLERIDGIRYRRSFDGEVRALRPLGVPTDYDAVSHLQARGDGQLSAYGRRIDTALPPQRNPRSQALAHKLRAQSSSDADFAARVLAYFRGGGFEYSLTPPLLNYDSVDDLLFNTRQGFCGHFASAFAMLMRAGGVPARVVTGYLGGTWNSIGHYYTVRQSDAHAWVEAWLPDRGWTRFDPTGVVAPERLQRGAGEETDSALAEGNALLGQANWLRGLRDAWDAAGNWWQEQIVNFNRAKQRNLLAALGLEHVDYGGMVLLLTAGGALWALLLLALLTRRVRPVRRDALARLWERFITLLRRQGISVAAHDGPEAIRIRAQQ